MRESLLRIKAGWRLGCAAVMCLGANPAAAVQKTWLVGPDVEWGTATNWSPNGEPTSVDDVLFSDPSAYTVRPRSTDDTLNAQSVSVTNGDVTFVNGSGDATDLIIGGTLAVGFLGTSPTLTLDLFLDRTNFW